MNGYHGRFLKVDLGEQKTQDIPLSEDDLRDFIGGATLAAAMVYDHIKRGMDPLAPESPLVFSTGPFTGTLFPMVSRYAVTGVSPQTGYWGEATSGGKFPSRLKGSGYDGIFFVGQADRPVYLYIDNGSTYIRDASHLWGKDTYETQRIIKEELGKRDLSVACIGMGGERLIKYASIMNDRGRAAARCGLGAVMGSKNLKAVAVSGKMKTDLADGEKLKKITKDVLAEIKKHPASVALGEYGTLFYMDIGMSLGDVPARYFSKNIFQVEKITGQALRQAYTVNNYACHGCPIGCGREIKNFAEDMDSIDGPEYETTSAFGPLCMNTDLSSIIRANHFCNAHGIDTISAGVSVAYAMYLYEQGVLSRDDAGMEIRWGDGEAVVKLVEMIIHQEGIGKLLSQGTLRMAQELGRDNDETAQVKGLEIPMHDIRAFHGLALSYATSPRGACHLKGDYYSVDMGRGIPELDITPHERMSSKGKAENAAKFQSLKDLYDALPLCKFAPLSVTDICEVFRSITGWDIDAADLLIAGDRSINIKRAISNKLGMTRQDDRLPKICLAPLKEGATAGKTPDMELLLKEYYTFRHWDWETGKPLKEKLIELGLTKAARDLYP